MKNALILLPLLAITLAAQAQTTGSNVSTEATPYQVQYDSLLSRAQRVRAEVAARTVVFRAGFAGIGGTRRVIISLGQPKVRPVTDVGSRVTLLKRETVKHKTHGAEVKKVAYYSGARQRLYEYSEDGHLVQLYLFNYPLATGGTCTMQWVQGNYLRVSQHIGSGGSRRVMQDQVFTQPELAPN